MSRRLTGLVAASLLAGLVSCTQDGPTQNTLGQSANRSCNVDSECAQGFVCDKERRFCVCQSDAVCPAQQYCNAFTGKCESADKIPGCKTDGDCRAGFEYCENATRVCRAIHGFCSSCLKDLECGGGQKCLRPASAPPDQAGFCGHLCASEADCAAFEGTTCKDTVAGKSCMPAGGLTPSDGTECAAYHVCIPDNLRPCAADAHCLQDCSHGEACPPGQSCDSGTKTCAPPDQVCDLVGKRCVAKVRTCPVGQVCAPSSRRCVAACHAKEDCGPGQSCVNNVCVASEVCAVDTDCPPVSAADPNGQTCSIPPGSTQGNCVQGCDPTADPPTCPIGTICGPDPTIGNRAKCEPGCVDYSDCPPNASCVGGQCQYTQGFCQINEACDRCQVCTNQNVCVPAKAASRYDCKPCTTDNQCGPGGICLGGTSCGQDCSLTQLCPRGFQCLFVDNSTGGTGQVCVAVNGDGSVAVCPTVQCGY